MASIKDNGPGIPPAFKEKLFHKFERAQSEHNISGRGVGLYIVKNLIEAHGGLLELKSHKDQGVEFIVKLPLFRRNKK